MATSAQTKLRQDRITAAADKPDELKLAKMNSDARRFSKRNAGKERGKK